jgi:hypothetical protein
MFWLSFSLIEIAQQQKLLTSLSRKSGHLKKTCGFTSPPYDWVGFVA